jgi:hypothetical protein
MGIAPMSIKSWFTPFNEGRYVHPYALDGQEDSVEEGGPRE